MSLLQELKRRNVFRVGALYLVASWILLQMTDVLSSLLPVPEWAGSFIFMLLALGLFPALIFAWVYEMTPEGLKKEADVDRSRSVTPDTGHKINTVIIVLLVIAIAGVVVDRLIPETTVDAEVVAEAPAAGEPGEAAASAQLVRDDHSIAVLPFADLSQEQDQRYFTDGLSEELLNLLVRVDDLHVASRTSAFALRNSTMSIPQISKELNVDHILEGSVRKDGDRIRITAQLIEAATDKHLWSENFDREFNDIFTIQDEIANAIVVALTGELGVGEKVITVEAATENVDAYEMYLTARELFLGRVELPESIRLFNAALKLDPNFARAWEGLAAVEAVANDWIVNDGIDHDPLAKQAAQKALELNPDLSMPLAVLGAIESTVDHDYVAAMDYFNAAIEKDPKNATAWLWRGLRLKLGGYTVEAMADLRHCLSIDPGYQNCKQHLADTYLQLGEIDTALQLHSETLEHGFYSVSETFVPTYVRMGHRELAIVLADAKMGARGAPVIEWIRAIENPDADNRAGYARMKDWERRYGSDGVLANRIWPMLLAFREHDEMLARFGYTYWGLWHPDGDDFRRSPQFKAMVRQTGIYEFWKHRGLPPQCRAVGDDDFECGRPGQHAN
jgi:TolB-like protein